MNVFVFPLVLNAKSLHPRMKFVFLVLLVTLSFSLSLATIVCLVFCIFCAFCVEHDEMILFQVEFIFIPIDFMIIICMRRASIVIVVVVVIVDGQLIYS